METKVEKLKLSRLRTMTTIDEAKRTAAEERALVRLASQVEIKGFRVGKAPADKVRERVGGERLMEETVRELLPEVLKDALEKSKAKPMLRPAANVVSMSPLTISLTFVERPEVKVKKAEGLTVEKKEPAVVTEKDIEDFVKRLLSQDRTELPVDRAAKNGDVVQLSLSATKKGKPVEELTVGHYGLALGSEELLPQLEEHALGMKKDDKKKVDVTFPKDHSIPALKGEKITIEMTAKAISEVKLPELTPEYLKNRLGADRTPDAFRADIREMLTQRRRSDEMKRREEEMYEKVRTATSVELADEIIDAEVQDMVADLEMRLKQQNMTMEDWLKATGKDVKGVIDEMKDIAKSRITLRFGMQELAKAKNIEIKPETVDAAVKSTRERAQKDGRGLPEDALVPGGSIYEEIKFDLTMQSLIDSMIRDEKK